MRDNRQRRQRRSRVRSTLKSPHEPTTKKKIKYIWSAKIAHNTKLRLCGSKLRVFFSLDTVAFRSMWYRRRIGDASGCAVKLRRFRKWIGRAYFRTSMYIRANACTHTAIEGEAHMFRCEHINEQRIAERQTNGPRKQKQKKKNRWSRNEQICVERKTGSFQAAQIPSCDGNWLCVGLCVNVCLCELPMAHWNTVSAATSKMRPS